MTMSSSSKKGGAEPTGEAKKFLFNNKDFGEVKTRANTPVYTEDQLLLAKNQSFAQGKTEGAADARKEQGERLLELLQKFLAHADHLAKNEDRREIENSAESIKLVMRVAHKLLPRFASQFALSEIQNVILQALEARRDEPRIAVTVPTAHLDALKEKIDAIALEKGYAGKVILVADDSMALTDCRVEWADGGAERLYEKLFSQIDNEFTKAVAGLKMLTEEKK
jgi:flagellar assembly protein FliH